MIPRRRRQAKLDFERRINQLRTHLKDVLTRQVHLELEQSTARINEASRHTAGSYRPRQQRLDEARSGLITT